MRSCRTVFYCSLLVFLASCDGPPIPSAARPHVVFVILDNLRADRLALCGYERPTSRVLNRLCARDRASCSCGAEAPSTWTIPSHASYFTGTEVPQHGAGIGSRLDTTVELAPGTFARPLDDRLPTLAERFGEQGYQTLFLSGNPLLSPASGLTRGFDVQEHAVEFGTVYGPRLFRRLEAMLANRESERPLFLFVNIADAHRPWFGIPAGKLKWLPPRPRLGFAQEPGAPNETRRRFVTGEMDAEEEQALLEHLGDVYDYAVWRADWTLGRVLSILREAAVFQEPFRLVITSDHGEHLGEHGLLGHAGPYLFEEITRVPVVVFSSQGAMSLPELMPALNVYDLLLYGELRRRPVQATAHASDTWPVWYGPQFGTHPAAALWSEASKTVHQDGAAVRYDLTVDPSEMQPLSPSGSDAVGRLEALLRALAASNEGHPSSQEMKELLKSLGYI